MLYQWSSSGQPVAILASAYSCTRERGLLLGDPRGSQAVAPLYCYYHASGDSRRFSKNTCSCGRADLSPTPEHLIVEPVAVVVGNPSLPATHRRLPRTSAARGWLCSQGQMRPGLRDGRVSAHGCSSGGFPRFLLPSGAFSSRIHPQRQVLSDGGLYASGRIRRAVLTPDPSAASAP